MSNKIGLKVTSDMMSSICLYEGLINYFPQLTSSGSKYYDRMRKMWDDRLKNVSVSTWCKIDLHIINQLWGNTSRGWEGIGGSAMSESYTVVIENSITRLAFIYYDGKLAYICVMDESYVGYRTSKRVVSVPGYRRSD